MKQTQGQVLDSLESLIKSGDIEIVDKYWIDNVFHIKATDWGIDKLGAVPGVLRVMENILFTIPELPSPTAGPSGISPVPSSLTPAPSPIISPLPTISPTSGISPTADPTLIAPTPTPTGGSIEWNIAKIGADKVWNTLGITGGGVTVANLDTGVNWTHPALQNTYRGWNGTADHTYNWFDAVNNQTAPYDDMNPIYHGTHTMGTIIGKEGNINQIGVAPGAKWIAAKFLDSGGSGSFANGLKAMQWLLAPTKPDGSNPDPSKAPKVVSNSWGDGGCNDVMRTAVKAWRDAGIVPVFAIGNSGPYTGSANSPGDYPESIGVGATDINDTIASFSSRGPSCPLFGAEIKPEVSAPGVNIRSSQGSNSYGYLSGTSMATPHVAGLVALLLSANKDLTADQIEQVIKTTTLDLGSPGADNDYGAGRIDAFKAVSQYANSGTLEGTVTNSIGGSPLWEVSIKISSGTYEVNLTTGQDGKYTTKLPEGTYNVAFSKFAYDNNQTTVTIKKDQTTTANITLTPSKVYKLSGQVKSDTGQPLQAKITLVSTPVAPIDTDSSGKYSIFLPGGSYKAWVQSKGFQTDKEKFTISADTTLNFQLHPTPKLPPVQDFESGLGSWNADGLWHIESSGNPCANPHGGIRSAYYGKTYSPCNYDTGSANSGALSSPTFFVPEGTSDVNLSFWQWHQTETTGTYYDKRLIQVKEESDNTWTSISQLSGDPMNTWTQNEISLNRYKGKSIQIRFYFDTIDKVQNNYRGWYIDDVKIYQKTPDVYSTQMVPTTVQRGQTLVFLVNYGNDGGIPAENVVLDDSWEIPIDGTFAKVDTKGLSAKVEMKPLGPSPYPTSTPSPVTLNPTSVYPSATPSPAPSVLPSPTPSVSPSITKTPPPSVSPIPSITQVPCKNCQRGGFKINLGTLQPGQEGIIEVQFIVGQNAKLNDIFKNTVQVSTTTPEENSNNNLSVASVRVITAELVVDINQPTTVKSKKQFTSITKVANIGDVTADNVGIDVDLSGTVNYEVDSVSLSFGPSPTPKPTAAIQPAVKKTHFHFDVGSLALNESRIITVVLHTTKAQAGNITVVSNATTTSQESYPNNQIVKTAKITK